MNATHPEFDENLKPSFLLNTPWGKAKVKLNIAGEQMISNALASAAVGLVAGLSLDSVVEGLSNVELSPLRMEITKTSQA